MCYHNTIYKIERIGQGEMDVEDRVKELGRQVLEETGKIIIGKEHQVKLTLVAL